MRISVGTFLLALVFQASEEGPRIEGEGGWSIILTIDPLSEKRTLGVTTSGGIVHLTKDGSPLLIAAPEHDCPGKALVIKVDQNEGIVLGEKGRRDVALAFKEMLAGEKAVISYFRQPCDSVQYNEVSLQGFAETVEKLKTLPPEELDRLAASIIEERRKSTQAIGERFDAEKALLAAARDGDRTKVLALLAQGVSANVRTESNGYTPLIWASARGHAEVVRTLLAWGADMNAQASDGQTALMRACDNGHLEVVAPLLGSGADVNITTEQGITALKLATLKGHQQIADLLRYVGAKE